MSAFDDYVLDPTDAESGDEYDLTVDDGEEPPSIIATPKRSHHRKADTKTPSPFAASIATATAPAERKRRVEPPGRDDYRLCATNIHLVLYVYKVLSPKYAPNLYNRWQAVAASTICASPARDAQAAALTAVAACCVLQPVW